MGLRRQIADDERAVLDPAAPPPAPTMYVGMDGTGFPMRSSEVIGRCGKQPDGTAKTREGKLATVWTAEGRDPAGRPVRDPGSVSYNAAVESAASRDTDSEPSAFAQRVYREAQRRGFTSATRPVVIGDGTHWIWNLAAEQFPGAVEIVDIYHAKQHMHDVAKAIYGPGTDLADQWAKAREDELDTGRLRALVRALRAARSMPEALGCLRYVVRNRHRMRYPQFRAQGLCVCSGVVEAGCKLGVVPGTADAGCRTLARRQARSAVGRVNRRPNRPRTFAGVRANTVVSDFVNPSGADSQNGPDSLGKSRILKRTARTTRRRRGTLTLEAGESSATVDVAVLDDSHDEGEETLTLTPSSASGGRISDAEATGTIENADLMPAALLARFRRVAGRELRPAVAVRPADGRGSDGWRRPDGSPRGRPGRRVLRRGSGRRRRCARHGRRGHGGPASADGRSGATAGYGPVAGGGLFGSMVPGGGLRSPGHQRVDTVGECPSRLRRRVGLALAGMTGLVCFARLAESRPAEQSQPDEPATPLEPVGVMLASAG